MKFKVDTMPYDADDCPFCERYYKNDKYQRVCKIDGHDCTYFQGKKRNDFGCRWLIDDETESKLRDQR